MKLSSFCATFAILFKKVLHYLAWLRGANQIVAQNLHKNQHAHTVAVPEECYSGYLDTVPPERISVFSLFFYKDTVPPGRLCAVRFCVKSAGCKVMGANKH